MRWFPVVLLLAACGVTYEDVSACQTHTKKLVADLGCKLRWVSCMDVGGTPKCEFEADCADGLKHSSNTCLEM